MDTAIRFEAITGHPHEFVISAPGRTELGGNHTDHQHGLVLAAPVDLAATAYVRRNDQDHIRVFADGFDPFQIPLQDTGIHPEECGTPAALFRGIANAFAARRLPGFDCLITSDIPMGSGLSSSAAIEILIGRICCRLTDTTMSPTELAILGQKVENEYFGKPCGLMDQMACASDGIIAIDFRNPSAPEVEEINLSFRKAGYVLCIVKCGAGHENMTAAYADITIELAGICRQFGVSVLREVQETEFYARLPELREMCGDRAVLRAIHVFEDNRRVRRQVEMLKAGNMDAYLDLVRESGQSSWKYLQNVIPEGFTIHQEMAVALALAEKCLQGKGAVRVHGGGFAGTIQAYVPMDREEEFIRQMDGYLEVGSCIPVQVGNRT